MKQEVDRSYMLHGGFPWIVEIQDKNKEFGKGTEIQESMSLGEIEEKFNLKDGASILELRALKEFTLTKENGNWYIEKTGIGYA